MRRRVSRLLQRKHCEHAGEQHTFIRWKLKKTVPFDIETAQVSFRIVETRPDGHELLVALSPRAIVGTIREADGGLDIQAGS